MLEWMKECMHENIRFKGDTELGLRHASKHAICTTLLCMLGTKHIVDDGSIYHTGCSTCLYKNKRNKKLFRVVSKRINKNITSIYDKD